MKKGILRAVCVLCCVSLLMTLALAAKLPTDDYEFPDDWSRDALIFTVENGILAGDENQNLNPESNITRAEMAAVLVRLLGASNKADLSAYTDVHIEDWFYDELSAAVGAGIFNGTSKTTMEPEAPITREQAVVVLCRTFGIISSDREGYLSFHDGKTISDYARDSVSAMRQDQLVNGYEDNTFRPTAYITRAEVAQLLYNLLDCIADTPEEIPESGWVLYRGEEALPADLTLDGTLILGQSMPADLTAGNWSITGTLVLRTAANTVADLSGLTVGRLICAPLSGKVNASADFVCLWGGGVEYTGVASTLIVMGGTHTANGGYPTLQVRGGSLTLNGSSQVVTMDASTALTMSGSADSIYTGGGVTLSIGGTVGKVTLDGAGCKLGGAGHVGTVVVNYGSTNISIGYDVYDDSWYQSYQKDHDNALQTVQTMRVPCTVEKETTLYSDSYLTNPIRTLPAGSTVYNEWHPAGNTFYASCEDGTKGWVYRWDCYIPDDVVTTDGKLDYSKATKEGFVDLRGYSSATDYLIWVSRYTQKVIVYQGSYGDWEVIRTMPCSTGENNTPTPAGIYVTSMNDVGWDFNNYYVSNVTIFWGDHAFHSILLSYNGGIYDDRVGIPLSHGCVRMLIEDCRYISSLPLNTTVIVY